MTNPFMQFLPNIGGFLLKFGVVVFVLALVWFYLEFKKNSQKVIIHLDKLINNSRVYDNAYKGTIEKKDKDSGEYRLKIPSVGYYGEVPDARFFKHNMKGLQVLRGVHDGQGQIHWIFPDDNIYQEKTKNVQVPLKDKNGNIVYTNEPELDNEGNPIVIDEETGYRVMKNKNDKIILLKPDNSTQIVDDIENMKFIKSYKPEMTVKKIKETIQTPNEQVIEADIKLYFENKSAEFRERFKKEDKYAWLKQMGTMAVIGIIILMVAHISYKAMNENIQTASGDMQNTAHEYREWFEDITNLNKEDENLNNTQKKPIKKVNTGDIH